MEAVLMSELKVEHLEDDTYQVVFVDFVYNAVHEGHYEEMLFQGSLSDCAAYIQLKEKEYI
jgi:hypothetical protein